jgi:hypothetical protein
VPRITVKYRSKQTIKSEDYLKNMVYDTVQYFKNTNLDQFDTYFRFSKFISSIDDTDTSIQNSLVTIKLKYKLNISLNVSTRYEIQFNNPLNRGNIANMVSTVESDGFTYQGLPCYFGDDGQGKITIFRYVGGVKTIVNSNVGTVDYTTGLIVINSFAPSAIASGSDFLNIMVTPLYNDVEIYRKQMLMIEQSDVTIIMVDESVR